MGVTNNGSSRSTDRARQNGERLDQPVWYVAYGSNVLKERFLTYLQGGPIPNSTTGQRQDAARDSSLPTSDQPYAIDRTLFFAGSSSRWGDGGVAFLDADTRPASEVKGRAWRITLGQFEDLFRQENGLSDLVPIDFDNLVSAGRLEVVDRWYGRVEVVGQIEGLPVLTLASPKLPADTAPAHISYLAVIAEGLGQSWGLTAEESADYLAQIPGIQGRYAATAILADLQS